jgi:hypothetical protein
MKSCISVDISFFDDGFGNLVQQMKDWHEMMLEHGNIYKKKAHE